MKRWSPYLLRRICAKAKHPKRSTQLQKIQRSRIERSFSQWKKKKICLCIRDVQYMEWEREQKRDKNSRESKDSHSAQRVCGFGFSFLSCSQIREANSDKYWVGVCSYWGIKLNEDEEWSSRRRDNLERGKGILRLFSQGHTKGVWFKKIFFFPKFR